MSVEPASAIPFSDALAHVQSAGGEFRLGVETVPLAAAAGRVLARDEHASIDLPSFDNAAMDGFALGAAAGVRIGNRQRWQLVGEQFAGVARVPRIGSGECVRITTGAVVPEGTTAVVVKERCHVIDGMIEFDGEVHPGDNIRRRGEDVARGMCLAQAGFSLTPARLGLLAATGLARLEVVRRPAVAVFTTGDELVPPGARPEPGQVFDSNRVLLQSLLAAEGLQTLSWPALPDDPGRIRSALDDAAQAYDLILTCGGVSAGERDCLPRLLREFGQVRFWKVAMRPGMPVLFGVWGRALLLGLPGNPVSVLASFLRLARPLVDALQGRVDRSRALSARLRQPLHKSHSRTEFRRGHLECDHAGQLWVTAHAATGSHQQRGAAESNALIVLPEAVRDFEAGSTVEVEAYDTVSAP